jgi:hypothetical protein
VIYLSTVSALLFILERRRQRIERLPPYLRRAIARNVITTAEALSVGK